MNKLSVHTNETWGPRKNEVEGIEENRAAFEECMER